MSTALACVRPDTVAFRRVSRRDAVVLTGTSLSSDAGACVPPPTRSDSRRKRQRHPLFVGTYTVPRAKARAGRLEEASVAAAPPGRSEPPRALLDSRQDAATAWAPRHLAGRARAQPQSRRRAARGPPRR